MLLSKKIKILAQNIKEIWNSMNRPNPKKNPKNNRNREGGGKNPVKGTENIFNKIIKKCFSYPKEENAYQGPRSIQKHQPNRLD